MSEEGDGERIAVLETKVDALTDSLKEHREETKKTARSLNEFISCVKRDRAEQKGALRVAVAIANGTGLLLGFAAANAKAIVGALGVVVR